VKAVLRNLAWFTDAVLSVVWPLEREPSMWDLEAEALADREAEEEVAEPRNDYWRFPVTSAQFDHLIYLVEDIRNLLSSFAPVVQPGVADETPGLGEHAPAPEAGQPKLPDLSWVEFTRNPFRWK